MKGADTLDVTVRSSRAGWGRLLKGADTATDLYLDLVAVRKPSGSRPEAVRGQWQYQTRVSAEAVDAVGHSKLNLQSIHN